MDALLCHLNNFIATMINFLNFILMDKLNIQIQISLMMGDLYSAGLVTGILVERMNE